MKKNDVWLEVALNGAAGKQYQPLIPIRPKDLIIQGVECAKAGASIVHLHAYDENGLPTEDVDIYRRVIEGIKAQVDVIVYPTLALMGSIEERFASIETLSQDGLLDWGVVDPGSVNITHTSQLAAGLEGFVYQNPDSHILYALALAEKYGWRPAYAIYEPGFARLGAAMAAKFPAIKSPIYRLMFSDNLLFGMPPKEDNLAFYASFLSQLVPDCQWMLSGLDAYIDPLIELALDRGAHIRVGLEDAPFGCEKSNLELVENCVKRINQHGHHLGKAD